MMAGVCAAHSRKPRTCPLDQRFLRRPDAQKNRFGFLRAVLNRGLNTAVLGGREPTVGGAGEAGNVSAARRFRIQTDRTAVPDGKRDKPRRVRGTEIESRALCVGFSALGCPEIG